MVAGVDRVALLNAMMSPFNQNSRTLFWNELDKTLHPDQSKDTLLAFLMILTALWFLLRAIVQLVFFDDFLRVAGVRRENFSTVRTYITATINSTQLIIWGSILAHDRYHSKDRLYKYDQFKDHPYNKLFVLNAVGYFTYDLMRGLGMWDLSGEYILHHITTITLFGYCAFFDRCADIATFALLWVEIPNPFLNMRMLCRYSGRKGSTFYWTVSYTFTGLFILVRWPLEMLTVRAAYKTPGMPFFFLVALIAIHSLTWFWGLKILKLFAMSCQPKSRGVETGSQCSTASNQELDQMTAGGSKKDN